MYAANSTILFSALFMIALSFRRFSAELPMALGDESQKADDTLLLALLWLLLALAVPGGDDEPVILLGLGITVLVIQSMVAIYGSIRGGRRDRVFSPSFLAMSGVFMGVGMLWCIFSHGFHEENLLTIALLSLGCSSATIAVMMSTQDSFRRGTRTLFKMSTTVEFHAFESLGGEVIYANGSARGVETESSMCDALSRIGYVPCLRF